MRRRRSRSRAQALVEFALVIPILVIALMALFDFGQAVLAYNSISNASRAAIRTAVVDQNTTVIEDRARSQTIGLNPDSLTVDTSTLIPDCVVVKIGCQATLTVTYDWQAITPIIGGIIGPIELSSTTAMPIERVHTSP